MSVCVRERDRALSSGQERPGRQWRETLLGRPAMALRDVSNVPVKAEKATAAPGDSCEVECRGPAFGGLLLRSIPVAKDSFTTCVLMPPGEEVVISGSSDATVKVREDADAQAVHSVDGAGVLLLRTGAQADNLCISRLNLFRRRSTTSAREG